ncbi:MAG: hypothetical protein OHK0031_00020 [Anaerolineales bacterium]
MSSPATSEHFSSELQARNTGLITRTDMAAAWLSGLMFAIGAFQEQSWQMIGLAINGLALAIGLSLAYLLNRNRRSASAIWLTALMLGITFTVINFFVSGLGTTIAILGLLIYINLALQTLPTRPAIGLMLLGAAFMAAAWLVDQRGFSADRISVPLWIEQTIVVLGGIVVLTLSVNLLERFEFRSLRGQLTLAFLLIALIPLWTTSIPQLLSIRQSLNSNSNDLLLKNAQDTASEMDDLLDGLKQQVKVSAEIPLFKTYLSGAEDRAAETLETIYTLSGQDDSIVSGALLNPSGVDLLDTQPYRVSQSAADSGWFRQSMLAREPYVSELIYDENLLRPILIVTAPIFNDNQKILGLMRFIYDGQIIQQELERQNDWLGENQHIILIDQNNIILAHNNLPELQMKTLTGLREEQVTALQSSGQLAPGEPESLDAGLQILAQSLKTQAEQRFIKTSLLPGETADQYATVVPLATKNWRIVFSRAVNEFAPQLVDLNNTFLLISSLMVLVVAAAASLTARLITSPLKTLTQSAQEIGQSGLETSIQIARKDEIGLLSEVMEKTARQLRETLQGLENRITERTNALEAANAQSARRATQLRALAQVANSVTNLQDLESLLPQVTQTISRAFGFYHVGIFLLDASGSLAILRAANSPGGQKMLQRGHQLKVGQVGLVGYVTASGESRIALDVGADAVFFNNPDLPETRSEAALPLKVGSQIIGALDVQSRAANAFSAEDLEVLGLLADQIAIAIHNANLYEETNQALQEAQLIFGQRQRDSWEAIGRSNALGFRYRNGQIEAIRREEIVSAAEDGVLQLPISLRGENLGTLQIHMPQQKRSWTTEEVRLYQTILERLAYSLENARLFQDAQRLASKERVIGEIGTRIGASINLDNILQTTVQELSHVIPDSQIVIQLKTADDEDAG